MKADTADMPAGGAPPLLFWAEGLLREQGVSKPRLNAEQMLSHCTGRSRVDLYAYPERDIPPTQREAFALCVRRRASREPLQYILGSKGFRYLELAVDRRVLIPRPETEMLVERALELLEMAGGHPVVVDVGTGSGCIALSICRECPSAVVHATDICGSALEAARDNAVRLGLEGVPSFHLGDLLDALPPELRKSCDLIVSNPPYIREGDFPTLPPEVREHEPYRSLVAGPLGVEKHLSLMRQAPWWLAPGGWLLMEGAEDRIKELALWAEEMGYREVGVLEDLNHRPRVIEMRAPANP